MAGLEAGNVDTKPVKSTIVLNIVFLVQTLEKNEGALFV